MVTIAQVGEISIPAVFVVEWKIKDFFSLSADVGKGYISPSFSFHGESWFLKLYTNGTTNIKMVDGQVVNTEGYVNVYLYRSSSGPPITVEFSLRLQLSDDLSGPQRDHTFVFENPARGFGSRRLMKRSELLKNKYDFKSSDVFSVVCTLKDPAATEVENNTVIKKCFYCKSVFEVQEDLTSHEKKCINKPIKCPGCYDVIALKDWHDHDCQRATAEAPEKLSNDFKALMLSGDHSDTIIKVKEEEFRLHRIILSARSPYFDSMFKRDSKENSRESISFDDCDPDIFRFFIQFLYTGKMNELSRENVYSLHDLAEKFQQDELKKECLYFIKNTIQVDNSCNFIAAA